MVVWEMRPSLLGQPRAAGQRWAPSERHHHESSENCFVFVTFHINGQLPGSRCREGKQCLEGQQSFCETVQWEERGERSGSVKEV